jgi:hypothetical protein
MICAIYKLTPCDSNSDQTWLQVRMNACAFRLFASNLPLSVCFRYLHYSQAACGGPRLRKKMANSPQIGRTRSQPDSELISSQPIEKKPRLDNMVDTSPSMAAHKPSKGKKYSAKQKKRKQEHTLPEPYSSQDVLWRDIESVLGKEAVGKAIEDGIEWDSPFEFRQEVEIKVASLSCSGAYRPWILVLSWTSQGLVGNIRAAKGKRYEHSYTVNKSLEALFIRNGLLGIANHLGAA